MHISDFFNAIKKGDIDAVRRALAEGMSCDVKNEAGQTALDVACFCVQEEIAELLRNPQVANIPALETTSVFAEANPICIVGYSSIFPGSGHTPEGFWQTLIGDTHKMKEVPLDRWPIEEFYSPDKKAPGKMYTRRGGFIDQSPYDFDAEFFQIVPKEMETMDPQQRLMLEAAWYALEHAGINPFDLKKQMVGIYCGIMTHDYIDTLIEKRIAHNNFIGTGNAASVLSGRLSYFFDLQGPCITVDTACSSSLVTAHLAVKSLQNEECDLALAGGVNAMLAPGVTINCCKAHMLSEDGICKTFSEQADGYARGEGAGMLVLKRYRDAKRDGNAIYGVIRGSAVNHDGATSGLTVPSKQAQIKVIETALNLAKLTSDDIDFIEAHGTGTLLGDPIEIDALKTIFAKRDPKLLPILINSVKTFVGHLEAAAGVAGIIRVLESFRHQSLTALPIQGKMNSKIQLTGTQLSILQEKKDWSVGSRMRRAGISSFGFSGTNAHIILEEPPKQVITLQQRLEAQWEKEQTLPIPERASYDEATQLLTLSAKNENALICLVQQYRDLLLALSPGTHDKWCDLAYSNQTGRAHFSNRLSIQATSMTDCLHQLQSWTAASVKKMDKGPIQIMIPDLKNVDLSSFQQRYQNDVLFQSICCALAKETMHPQFILNNLSGQVEAGEAWHQDAAKLVAMYAMHFRYQRMGIPMSQVISQGAGHFLAAVIDGRLTWADMICLFKAYSLKDENLYRNASCIVPYSSQGHWIIESSNICEDLYNPRPELDQTVSSPLVLNLGFGAHSFVLNSISTLYLAGYDINWKNLWQGSIRQFMALPLYPFQRQSYRFHAVQQAPMVVEDEIPVASYVPTWEKLRLISEERLSFSGPVLLIITSYQSKDLNFIRQLKQSLSSSGLNYMLLSEGPRSQENDMHTISFNDKDDWQWFSSRLRSAKVKRVIDLRYMDQFTDQQMLTQRSLSEYFSTRLLQSQLCFQAWTESNIVEYGYFAFFPYGKSVRTEIQLCHAGVQGQLRSLGLSIVSVQIDVEPDCLLQALTDLIFQPIKGISLKFTQNQWLTEILTRIPLDPAGSTKHLSMPGKLEGIVITGGLGALGMTVARWYAEKGASHIALIARREPSAEQSSELYKINIQYGVSIKVYQADVTDQQQLITTIKKIGAVCKIQEVYHLAGQATIKRFDQLKEQDYRDSFSAKVLGAMNLRDALKCLPYWPEQVVLFSSVASILPESGQTAYAASNHMLDALALTTQHTSQLIRVINWGLWGAAGVGAHPDFIKRIRKGSGVLSEMETKIWLDLVLSCSEPQLAVLKINWAVYQNYLAPLERVWISSLLTPTRQIAQTLNLRSELLSLNEPERREKIAILIKNLVAEVSGQPVNTIHYEMAFQGALNLDSNLLVEIKDLLQEKVGSVNKPYPATLLMEHESIDALTNYLLIDLASQLSVVQEEDSPTDYIRQLVQHSGAQATVKLLNRASVSEDPSLILIHTIMGSVFFYKALIAHLNYAGPIYGIDDPYFSNLSKKFSTIHEMAQAYANIIRSQFSGKSVRLAGLSFAGAVAYEVAQQLYNTEVKIENVLMFDTAMPSAAELNLPQTETQYVMGEIAEDINQYYQAEIENNQRILNAYMPQAPRYPLRVILLKARSRDSVNRALPSLNEVCNGWLSLFCPEVYTVPGSHFSLFDRTYVQTTVQAMRYAYSQKNYLQNDQPNSVIHNREKLFLHAAKQGDSYLIVRLLKENVNPMVLDEHGHHAACYAAENDDLCSLAWIHYYAKEQLSMASLFQWAIQGKSLKAMSYLVENKNVTVTREPDLSLLMDTNKKQLLILNGISQPYLQREWMEILAAHNESVKDGKQESALQILPPTQTAKNHSDLIMITDIICSNFKYEVVTKLQLGLTSKPNLFMFHAASGLAAPYIGLKDLGFGTVYGISNPYFGRHDLSGFVSVETMARHYIDRIKKIQPKGPYFLAGWSLGGIVSQAISSLLENSGESVELLIMIDSVNHFGKPYYQDSEKAAIRRILTGHIGMERYPDMIDAIQRCYLNTGDILRNHHAKPFSGRSILLKAEEQETTLEDDPQELIQWRQSIQNDPFLGWGDLLPNLEVQSVRGSHNALFNEEHIQNMHAMLKEILASVELMKATTCLLSQRWGMNLVKALRRDDSKIITLLLNHLDTDYSFQDTQGNLLDVIVVKERTDILNKLNKQALKSLKTSAGSSAAEVALELGLFTLFEEMEQSPAASAPGRGAPGFFSQGSTIQTNSNRNFELPQASL